MSEEVRRPASGPVQWSRWAQEAALGRVPLRGGRAWLASLGGGGAKRSDFRLILETEPTGFVGRVDVGCLQETWPS